MLTGAIFRTPRFPEVIEAPCKVKSDFIHLSSDKANGSGSGPPESRLSVNNVDGCASLKYSATPGWSPSETPVPAVHAYAQLSCDGQKQQRYSTRGAAVGALLEVRDLNLV